MNREVKFKALKDDMSNCTWVYGNLVYFIEELWTKEYPAIQEGNSHRFTSCLNGTECQYTGLKDKNGKECYHKDILNGFGKLWLIEWQQEEARFILQPTGKNTDSWKFMDEVDRMKIVGNIYENKNLLEK